MTTSTCVRRGPRPRTCAWAFSLALTLLAGCGSGGTSTSAPREYTPQEAIAKSGLHPSGSYGTHGVGIAEGSCIGTLLTGSKLIADGPHANTLTTTRLYNATRTVEIAGLQAPDPTCLSLFQDALDKLP